MSFDYRISNNPYHNYTSYSMNSGMPSFNGVNKNPVEKIQEQVEKQVSIFTQEANKDETKKSNSKAIALGITTALLVGSVFVLNPKNSPKLMAKIKDWQINLANKAKHNKDSFLNSGIYKFGEKAVTKLGEVLNFSNNFNSIKDIYFKNWLTKEKSFSNIKNENIRGVFKSVDKGFTGIMKKTYSGITKWFDNISIKTVLSTHKKTGKQIKSINDLIRHYGENLPADKRLALEKLIKEIESEASYFGKNKTLKRLKIQEKNMENLEEKVIQAFKDYRKGYKDPLIKGSTRHNTDYAFNNLNFWAQDALNETKQQTIENGEKILSKFFGTKKKNGLYDKIDDILKESLSPDEYKLYHKKYLKLNKKMHKSFNIENFEYFDKKRDLELGGGPTDILGSLGMLGLSGVLVARAKDKDERISKTITEAAPIIAGIGTSLAFTAMLYSGAKGLLAGALSTIVLSKIGQTADKQIMARRHAQKNETNQEVAYA